MSKHALDWRGEADGVWVAHEEVDWLVDGATLMLTAHVAYAMRYGSFLAHVFVDGEKVHMSEHGSRLGAKRAAEGAAHRAMVLRRA